MCSFPPVAASNVRRSRLSGCLYAVLPCMCLGLVAAQYVDLSKLHKNSLKRYLTHFGIEARGNTKIEL